MQLVGVAGHAHKHFRKGDVGYMGRAALHQGFSAVTGACLVVRRAVYEQVGGLLEELAVAFNDIDFCLRLREAGYRNVWTPYAELYHHESATRGQEDTPEKIARAQQEGDYMRQHWAHAIRHDPAYSPNLTVEREDFTYAWPPRVALPTVLSRADKVLLDIDRNGLGLEIGASHTPLVPKRQGFKVHILDHLDADGLRAKYEGQGENLDNIEEVDFVWSGQPLPELVGQEACYDWIIASHVIEHTPDFISFLSQCSRLLKRDGILSLAVPDKRYCFDYFGPLSTTGQLLDAHALQRTRPTPGQVFDYMANFATLDGNIAWGPGMRGEVALRYSGQEAAQEWQRAVRTEDYIDVHNWRFQPDSFALIIGDLCRLGLLDLVIERQFDTEGCEFHVSLRKGSAPEQKQRLAALNAIHAAQMP
jgi:SAM-dependent methyltransferase